MDNVGKSWGKDNNLVFRKVANKRDLYIIGVRDASYTQETESVAGEIKMLASKNKKIVAAIYWNRQNIRIVCTSPKAAETRGVMNLLDYGINMVNQISIFLKFKVTIGVFTDFRPY